MHRTVVLSGIRVVVDTAIQHPEAGPARNTAWPDREARRFVQIGRRYVDLRYDIIAVAKNTIDRIDFRHLVADIRIYLLSANGIEKTGRLVKGNAFGVVDVIAYIKTRHLIITVTENAVNRFDRVNLVHHTINDMQGVACRVVCQSFGVIPASVSSFS